METVLFICSLVACLIGVFTFISGMNTRAKADGVVLQKIDQAISGIEELKKDVRQQGSRHQDLALMVKSHDEKIHTLFKELDEVNKSNQVLTALLEAIKHSEDRS